MWYPVNEYQSRRLYAYVKNPSAANENNTFATLSNVANPPDAWNMDNGSWGETSDVWHSTTTMKTARSLHLRNTGTADVAVLSDAFTMAAGDKITLSAELQGDSSDAGDNLKLYAMFYNSGGSYISSSDKLYDSRPTGSSWTVPTAIEVTAPANTASAKLIIEKTTSTAFNAYIDYFKAELTAGSSVDNEFTLEALFYAADQETLIDTVTAFDDSINDGNNDEWIERGKVIVTPAGAKWADIQFTVTKPLAGSDAVLVDSVQMEPTPVYVRVGMSDNQAVEQGTPETIEFNTIIDDDTESFNTTTHKFTVPVSGYYQISISLTMLDDVGAHGYIELYQDGSPATLKYKVWQTIDALYNQSAVMQYFDYFNAGTVLYAVFGTQESGEDITYIHQANGSCSFSALMSWQSI